MISAKFALTLLAMCFFGMANEMTILLYAVIPNQIDSLYKESFLNNYGINLDVVGLSTVWSVMFLCAGFGTITGVLLLPLMDSRGRKFLMIYVRSVLTIISAILQLCSALLPSAELFILAVFLNGVLLSVRGNGNIVYVSECSPDKYRGIVFSLLIFGDTVGRMIIYTLARPELFGNYNWKMIPVLSLILAICFLVSLSWIPDSPKWLLGQGKKEAAVRAIRFYQGENADVETIILNINQEISFEHVENDRSRLSWKAALQFRSVKQTLYILFAIATVIYISPFPVSVAYPVIVNQMLGISQQLTMSLNTITSFASLPFHFLRTCLIDKIGRRPLILLAVLSMYTQNAILLIAMSISFFFGTSTVTSALGLLSEGVGLITGLTGLFGIIPLLISEMVHPTARVAITQMIAILPIFTSMFIESTVSFTFNFFPPFFYLCFSAIQPAAIFYIYKNLPETMNRPVCDIMREVRSHSLVKSRVGTLETSALLGRCSNIDYGGLQCVE